MAMTLKYKFVLWSALVLTLVLLLGIVSVWNLSSQWRGLRSTMAEYDAMDRAQAAAGQVAWLRDELRGTNARTYRDGQFFIAIQRDVREVERQLKVAAGVDDGDAREELDLGKAASDQLDAAMQASAMQPATVTVAKLAEAAGEMEKLRKSLVAVTKLVPDAARHHAMATTDRLVPRIWWTCIWLLVVLAVSAFIHYRQYGALVKPLVWLRDDMRRSASSEIKHEVQARGDGEFRDVAGYFNGLAHELAELYRNLEQKVIEKSRELVRSERLASVGFLAAGVAHEINNPLSIISGYAELAGKSLRDVLTGPGADHHVHGNEAEAEAEAEALSSALEAQEIIREEAFRCKDITSRLLSLARGGGDARQPLGLDEVARQVAVLTKGLKKYRDRRVVVDLDVAGPLEVVANPTEMKQVLLNLTVNALEAVPPEHGEVRIHGQRSGDWVEVSVEDNGKGMSSETLEQVFEPFFTAKRGVGEPGTGLGLSITHTIIENHGGRIRAESDGPGRGSRFTLRLPAARTAAALV
jgi:signal transduction histidine kinase